MYKERFNANKRVNVKYDIGDIVYIKIIVSTGYSTKLQPTYTGPLVVVGVDHSDIYRLKKLNDCRDKNYKTTANFSQLKVWKGYDQIDESDEIIVLGDNDKSVSENLR